MQGVATIKEVQAELKKQMDKAVDATSREFQNLRTGRASIHLVEGIIVNYYDTPTPIKGLATVTTPDPRTITIQPWDPSINPEIEKAILTSALGLTPINDGKVVRISIPALTDERRVELTKVVRKVAEEGKISVRAARHDANEAVKKFEKDKTITEDDLSFAQKDIQKVTDLHVKLIDEALEKKEKEITTI